MDIIIYLCFASFILPPPSNSQPVKEPLLAQWMDPELELEGGEKHLRKILLPLLCPLTLDGDFPSHPPAPSPERLLRS